MPPSKGKGPEPPVLRSDVRPTRSVTTGSPETMLQRMGEAPEAVLQMVEPKGPRTQSLGNRSCTSKSQDGKIKRAVKGGEICTTSDTFLKVDNTAMIQERKENITTITSQRHKAVILHTQQSERNARDDETAESESFSDKTNYKLRRK